ncbi:MAG TPA: hypothetical protein VLK85_12710, partial [Ramlibacter sp.]|nr:hypothetical protein [Ramlibacter sp.]
MGLAGVAYFNAEETAKGTAKTAEKSRIRMNESFCGFGCFFLAVLSALIDLPRAYAFPSIRST